MSIKATRQAFPLARYICSVSQKRLAGFGLVGWATTFGQQDV